MKFLNYLVPFVFVVLFLSSCSSDTDDRNVEENASAFVQANNKVVFFGSIDLKSILNKAEYKAVPKFGGIIQGELKNIESGLNLDAKVYYAIEGPMDPNNLGTVYLFAEVKNADSLKLQLTQRGYDLESDDDIDYFQSGDVAVGIKGKLALMMVKKGGFEVKTAIADAMELTTGKTLTGTAAKLIAEKSDISLNLHLYNNYISNEALLPKLAKDKKAQMEEMMKESFSQANIYFEEGQLRMAMKNHFSASLLKRTMLQTDEQAMIRENIGSGEPKIAMSMNLDMVKLQTWMDDYAPGVLDKLIENAGPMQMAMMMAGGKLSNLMSGKLGFAMYGNPTAGSMVPDFAFYMGFGPQGKPMAEMAQNFLSGGTMKLDIDERGVSGISSDAYKSVPGSAIKVPVGCETFGKTAFSGFANLENMDMAGFELKGGAKLVELVKYVNFTFDVNGGEILVKLKDPKTNVLKQSAQFMIKEFESQIGAMNP
ncbi:MAG: hypothetical protein WC044_05935 [Crocinitomicaceae bacterium]